MLVFFYDKTFEGLLTAVFDAYSRKMFPDHLVAEGKIPPMFMDNSYVVITQSRRAQRVWAAIEKKLSSQACNMLSYVWLSEIEGSDELLFRYICKAMDGAVSIENNFGDTDVLEAQQIARKVSKEAEYLRQFVRFQKMADDVFLGVVSPVYNALPVCIAHFEDRFSDQKWILYDERRHYGYFFDLETVQEMTLENEVLFAGGKLGETLMAEDESLFQELWKGYFSSMTIKERINLKLQKQHMPQRFWKYLIEKR